jgi:hypothetical protein
VSESRSGQQVKLDVEIYSEADGDFREGSWHVVHWIGCPEHRGVLVWLVPAGAHSEQPRKCLQALLTDFAKEILSR